VWSLNDNDIAGSPTRRLQGAVLQKRPSECATRNHDTSFKIG